MEEVTIKKVVIHYSDGSTETIGEQEEQQMNRLGHEITHQMISSTKRGILVIGTKVLGTQ